MTSSPRLTIDIGKLKHNAQTITTRLAKRGISVTGVTKAILGTPSIATLFLDAGMNRLADSRIENIETMQTARVSAEMTLLRSPMLSQVKRVVHHCHTSCNTEISVIKELSVSAQREGRFHGVILMVELGDLREGIMPEDLLDTVKYTLNCPNITFKGIGTNLACRCGVVPDNQNMTRLSELAVSIEDALNIEVETVSGGNSANLKWALSDQKVGRINNLRLGESILLGCEPLHRQPIDGLHQNAFTLNTEVIEAKMKPSKPIGTIAQAAFGHPPSTTNRGTVAQAIVAIGQQDIDPFGLKPSAGIHVMGASSDHLILESNRNTLRVGDDVTFQLNYSALVRAMTSPYVSKIFR